MSAQGKLSLLTKDEKKYKLITLFDTLDYADHNQRKRKWGLVFYLEAIFQDYLRNVYNNKTCHLQFSSQLFLLVERTGGYEVALY